MLRFARECAGLTDSGEREWNERMWAGLNEVGAEQSALQHELLPDQIFMDQFHSAISRGDAHIADRSGRPPEPYARACGWRVRDIVSTGEGKERTVRAVWDEKGHRIAWLEGDDLYVDLLACYRVFGRDLPVPRHTMSRRLNENGWLKSVGGKNENGALAVSRNIEGRAMHVLHMSVAKVLGKLEEDEL